MIDNYDDIDFGLSSNPGGAIDELYQIISESPQKIKLTPTQALAKLYSDINSAIISEDIDELKNIFKLNPDISSKINTPTIQSNVLNKFNPDIATYLMDRGLSITTYVVGRSVLDNKSIDMLKFFTDYAKKKPVDNSSMRSFVFNNLQSFNNIKSFSNDNLEGFYQELTYDLTWCSTLSTLLLGAKDTPNYKKMAQHLIKEFPNILDASVSYNNSFFSFFLSSPPDSQWHQDILLSLDKKVWMVLFNITFSDISFFKSWGNNGFSVKNIKLLTQILKSDEQIREMLSFEEKVLIKNHL